MHIIKIMCTECFQKAYRPMMVTWQFSKLAVEERKRELPLDTEAGNGQMESSLFQTCMVRVEVQT